MSYTYLISTRSDAVTLQELTAPEEGKDFKTALVLQLEGLLDSCIYETHLAESYTLKKIIIRLC